MPSASRLVQGGRSISGVLIGSLLLVHFVGLVVLKSSRGLGFELLWISHASLLLGGVAMLIGSARLVAAAFASIAVLHAIWIFDAACGVLLGRFPLGLTTYLLSADAAVLAATSHHLYLVPVLGLWLARRGPGCDEPGILGCAALSSAMFVILTLACRLLTPAPPNINFSHAVAPGSEIAVLRWFNRQSGAVYLPIHGACTIVAAIAPGAVLACRLRRLGGRSPLGVNKHVPASSLLAH